MRIVLFALLIGIACAAPAHAQATWTAPSGQFTLTFPRSWGVVPEPNKPREVLEHFGQTTPLVERKECYIDVLPFTPYAGLDQAAINEIASTWTERDAFTVMGFSRVYPSIQTESFETATVDGVVVATMHWTMMRDGAPAARTRQRLFVLTQNGVARRFAIHCLALDRGAPMNDIDAFLASLRFPVAQ